jgi:putative transcriptional regulator
MRPDEVQEITAPVEATMIETRLEQLLKDRNRTLYWLAKQVGTTYNTMHKLARGRADSVKFETLSGICRVLECTPGDVLVYVEDNKPARRATGATKATQRRSGVKAAPAMAGA